MVPMNRYNRDTRVLKDLAYNVRDVYGAHECICVADVPDRMIRIITCPDHNVWLNGVSDVFKH